jgi:hypothetical protein
LPREPDEVILGAPIRRVPSSSLFDAAAEMAKEDLAPNTIRNRVALLRRVRKPSLTANVFVDLERTDRGRLDGALRRPTASGLWKHSPRGVKTSDLVRLVKP